MTALTSRQLDDRVGQLEEPGQKCAKASRSERCHFYSISICTVRLAISSVQVCTPTRSNHTAISWSNKWDTCTPTRSNHTASGLLLERAAACVVVVYRGLELHRARGTKEMIELLGSRSMHARGPEMLIIILFSLLLEISSVQVCLMK
jgi:hypothetical protein